MKAKTTKRVSGKLRHEPVGEGRTNRPAKRGNQQDSDDENYEEEEVQMSGAVSASILRHARDQTNEQMSDDEDNDGAFEVEQEVNGEEEDGEEDEEQVDSGLVYVDGAVGDADFQLDQNEEDLVNKFLHADKFASRSLADIILEKLKEKEMDDVQSQVSATNSAIPPKVVEVYTSVGSMLQHYKSGKLPKALKMLPHLKNWEQILWLTRPDMWSPTATYAVTRIFVSNLKVKMAQRFFNLVLLEKCRDDINSNNKLNYHLYMALKKALFKPAAFYKGVLLPLAQSGTCSLREATIIGSVLLKVSIPAIHSAAALLRLAEMPYSGSTSLFIKTLLAKKYALPTRVLDALVKHFGEFADEKRVLPVIWHQSLLIFVQRYKMELDEAHRETLFNLIKVQSHHEMSIEVRRELIQGRIQK